MTITPTALLSLPIITTGTESGNWGDDVNNGLTQYLDIAIAGGLSVTVTTADVTLANTAGTAGSTNITSTSAQYAILNVSGAMTAARNLIVPSSSKSYIINNNTTGGFVLTVKGAATSGVGLVNGEKALIAWNGTDYVKISGQSGAGTFTSITNSSLTSGRVVYSTTGGLETDSANLTFDGTNLTNSAGAFVSTSGTGGTGYVGTSGTAMRLVNLNASSATQIIGNGEIDISTAGGYPIVFSTSGAEKMRLDSAGNLGIGTTSIAVPLHVNKTGVDTTAGWFNIAKIEDGSGNKGLDIGYLSGSQTTALIAASNSAASNMSFWTYNGSTWGERLRIDSSGNLGVGVTPSAWNTVFKAMEIGAKGSSVIASTTATSSGIILTGNAYYDSASWKYASTAAAANFDTSTGYFRWNIAPSGTAGNAITFTQAMTLDTSGNLGVGTTSPVTRLQVDGANYTFDTNAIGQAFIRSTTAYNSTPRAGIVFSVKYTSGGAQTAGGCTIQSYKENSTDGDFGTGLLFTTQANGSSPSEKLRIDSAGNLGLGVTPSAWSSGWKAFQLANGSSFVNNGATNYTGIFQNAYYNGANSIYLSSTYALKYELLNGAHVWYNSAAGTAGNAVTFTQAMTLDASGNLMLGTTTQQGRLHVSQNGVAARFTRTNNTDQFIEINGGDGAGVSSINANFTLALQTGGTEKMRLDSSGNLLVGTTTNSPGARLNLQGAAASVLLHASDGTNGDFYIDFPSSSVARLTAEYGTGGNLVFANGTSKTERARIDDSGNLLVGTTAAGASGGDANYITINKGAGYGANQWVMHVTGTSSGIPYMSFGYAGNSIGSITQSGTTSVLYNTTSDQRLKTNIADAESASTLIDAIQVRQFDWKTDNTHQRYGFIAQELVSVAPEAVHQPADSEDMMAVDYSKLVPMLVKEIQSLRARVAQLESK